MMADTRMELFMGLPPEEGGGPFFNPTQGDDMRTEVDPDGVFADIAERIKCECPMRVPAHKQRDPAKAPGQIRLWQEKGTDTIESMRLHDARKSATPQADEDVLELIVDATKR